MRVRLDPPPQGLPHGLEAVVQVGLQVKVVEGVLPGKDAADFVAERPELLLGESPMAPLLGLVLLILASPFVELAAHLGAPAADFECAVLLQNGANRVPEVGLEGLSTEILLRAVGTTLEEPETLRRLWTGAPVRESIALALYDDHRAALAGEGPHIIDPLPSRPIPATVPPSGGSPSRPKKRDRPERQTRTGP